MILCGMYQIVHERSTQHHMASSKINLIYIVGSGHCGSTLLDLLISSAPEVFTLGEFGFFNIYKENRIYNKNGVNNYCTCKRFFHHCPFWQTIKDRDQFFIKKNFSFSDTSRILRTAFSPFSQSANPPHTDDTFELLQAINTHYFGEANAPDYYLDSSKDPRRLYYLMNDSRLQVYPIFLVKNGTSVARSYSKPSRPHPKKHNFFMSYALRWLLVNKTAQNLLQDQTYTYVSYEDFCDTPLSHLASLNEQLDISIPVRSTDELLDTVNNTTYHSIDGNRIRFSPITEIKRKH